MTRVKYQAIYASTDREAARQYRIYLRQWKSTDQGHQQDLKRPAEISESERETLLSNKVVNEARDILQ